ncbi:MAG: 50S ribosomal protein L31 [Patescibacteria group bacterium]|nr:50S ribosomal protein L31 [Patescibacteria group bacterium]
MKKETHPNYFPDAKVTCACGNTFTVGATVEEIHVELCSNCHPFYTGKQKLVDTARRVEKFEERAAKKSTKTVKAKKDKKASRKKTTKTEKKETKKKATKKKSGSKTPSKAEGKKSDK